LAEKKTVNAEEAVKTENDIAGGWVLNYHARLGEYKDMCAQFAVLAATESDGMPHGTGTSNPCANKAVTLADINEHRDWLEVVELAERTLSEQKRMFINFRRLAIEINFKKEVGRPGWVDYVSAKYCEWHCRRYGVACLPARVTMMEWWSTIANVAARIAIRKGLI